MQPAIVPRFVFQDTFRVPGSTRKYSDVGSDRVKRVVGGHATLGGISFPGGRGGGRREGNKRMPFYDAIVFALIAGK